MLLDFKRVSAYTPPHQGFCRRETINRVRRKFGSTLKGVLGMHCRSLRRAANALLTGARASALAILALSVMSVAAWAQLDTGGSIIVTATDPTGSGIPGAALTLKDTSTNISRRAQTQQNGTYTFQGLTYGNYELTVTKDGFNSASFTEI
jgi:hypothetical protein